MMLRVDNHTDTWMDGNTSMGAVEDQDKSKMMMMMMMDNHSWKGSLLRTILWNSDY